MGARALWAWSRGLWGKKLVCRHDLREHKETHIVVECAAWGGWQPLYIGIELLALRTLCRWCKGFNLAHEPLQHYWLHPVFPPNMVTRCAWTFACKRTIKLGQTRQFFRLNSVSYRRHHAHMVDGSG